MKKLTRIMMLFALTAFAVSCDDNEDLFNEIIGDEDIELIVTDKEDVNAPAFASDYTPGSTFTALVDFTSSNDDMKRVYVTENYFGAGDKPFKLPTVSYDDKLDGSLDLAGANSGNFSFEIPFPVYDVTTTGEVVYTIWATSGRGDFRDTDKRLAVGIGTITVDYGGNNPETDVKAYSATLLAAPTGDGQSETFMSLLDGETYQINEGGEFVEFWDFGYYYGASGLSSFASVTDYPELFDHDNDANTPLIDVISLLEYLFPDTDVVETDFHSTYFAPSTMDFDAVTKSVDLDAIATPTGQRINQVAVGDIIEFVDNYGKAGLIKVTAINEGFTGSITIDVKVQP